MAETLAPRFNGAVHVSGTAQSSVGRCSPKSTTSVPERALLAHKTGSSLLTSSSPYTKSPLRPSPTVTPVSPVASSPSPVSPAVSARIGQFNSSGMSSPQPKSGSVVSTPSSRPGVFSPTSPKSPFNPFSVGSSSSPVVHHSSPSPRTTFTEDDADREIDSLNYGSEATVMDFYSKCILHNYTGSAIVVLEMAVEYVLERENKPGLFKEMVPDPEKVPKRELLKAYSDLSKTSTNPRLVARYGSQLANDYLRRSRTNEADGKREAAVNCVANAEILYDMVLNLTTRPGLGSFKREYEAKLAEAQAEKARLSATSSPMPKPSTPSSISTSSSGQPPVRTAHTPPSMSHSSIPGGMSSTPPKPVPGRFPPSSPSQLSTSVPSSRPAPLPPPQGSFSAPPSGTSVRPGFGPLSSPKPSSIASPSSSQSSSIASSRTPTPTSAPTTPSFVSQSVPAQVSPIRRSDRPAKYQHLSEAEFFKIAGPFTLEELRKDSKTLSNPGIGLDFGDTASVFKRYDYFISLGLLNNGTKLLDDGIGIAGGLRNKELGLIYIVRLAEHGYQYKNWEGYNSAIGYYNTAVDLVPPGAERDKYVRLGVEAQRLRDQYPVPAYRAK